jgi:hypothetical protein
VPGHEANFQTAPDVLSLRTMSDKDSRILHSFGDRLAVEQAIKALAQARNAQQQEVLARELAQKGPLALKALLRHLEDSNPAMRGGMGRLAKHLPPELVIPALRQAAMDDARTDNARLTAVMLLERYLGQEIDAAMAQRIPASYDVARESGEEALSMAQTEPMVLVEYAEQLLDEPPEIVQAVLHVILAMDDPAKVRLLLTIAAYADDALQEEILVSLGGIRHALTLQVLRTLEHVVSPHLQKLARRQQQKLQMAGVQELPGGALRALWSPVNAQGHSFLWFVHQSPGADAGNLLMLILQDELGVVYASAHSNIDLMSLASPAPRGQVHHVRMPESQHHAMLAEIDPALGLHLLERALQTMHAKNFPWPGEVVVFGHWLWQGTWDGNAASWPRLPKATTQLDDEASKALLEHPAFAGWAWGVPELATILLAHQHKTLAQGDAAHRQVIDMLMAEENRIVLRERLVQQARWLMLTKNRKQAMQTMAVNEALTSDHEAPPFVRILAWRSLLTAAADRAMRNALTLLEQNSNHPIKGDKD